MALFELNLKYPLTPYERQLFIGDHFYLLEIFGSSWVECDLVFENQGEVVSSVKFKVFDCDGSLGDAERWNLFILFETVKHKEVILLISLNQS